MTRLRLIVPVLCVLAAGGCSVTSAHEINLRETVPDQGEVARIQELSRRFSEAYVANDIETMVRMYTEDAVIFPGNSEALRGSEAIRRYWTQAPGSRVTMHRATPTEIRIDGDHAYDYGNYEISGQRDGTAWGPNYGKYVIVWRRTPEGWRMHLDMWNSRPAPAAR
ncbi:SgcJ/EcaC family oxidoreductase [Longimicrobium sp.]|uniref:YybH family protein n=1 Tax=Longimicrobium sp. TaxID=2029185 RepID=UPI002E2F70ED|nr:SgcJ/EcaC family oxidoreductase [Longimicrobium sp.]HEX6039863.1 SgcJ/EcaC family oxidoreductase [Longimicrobium sp.]